MTNMTTLPPDAAELFPNAHFNALSIEKQDHILAWYDGPLFYVAHDAAGGAYLVMLLDEDRDARTQGQFLMSLTDEQAKRILVPDADDDWMQASRLGVEFSATARLCLMVQTDFDLNVLSARKATEAEILDSLPFDAAPAETNDSAPAAPALVR